MNFFAHILKFTLLFFLLVTISWAKKFNLTNYYRVTKVTPQSTAILEDYERFINKTYLIPYDKQIKTVNHYINTLNSIYDSKTDLSADYWSSRGEFLLRGGGDCEDYAIAKYYTLKDLGVNPQNMCLLIVKEKYSGFYHMVLGIWSSINTQPLILDNLSFRVLPLDKRVDLAPHICINEKGYYTLNNQGKRVKKRIKLKSYEDMIKRQKKERMWIK